MVGGLLVAPKPSQAPAEGPAPTKASPAGPASGAAAPGDLSPRADTGDEVGVAPASPSPESAVLGLPREMSLAELFPAEAAMGAAAGDVILQDGELAAGQGSALGPDSGSSSDSRMPLVAGIVVSLAILLSGGGFLWWRNRDTNYWPA